MYSVYSSDDIERLAAEVQGPRRSQASVPPVPRLNLTLVGGK